MVGRVRSRDGNATGRARGRSATGGEGRAHFAAPGLHSALLLLLALGVVASADEICKFDVAAHQLPDNLDGYDDGSASLAPESAPAHSSSTRGCKHVSKMNRYLHETLTSVYKHANGPNARDRTGARNRLTSRAIAAISQPKPDFNKAIPLFRAAYFFQPFREDIVLNLARGLHDYAIAIKDNREISKLPLKRKKQIWRLLCESLAAAEMATYIQNQPLSALSGTTSGTAEFAHSVANTIDKFFPGRCHSTGDCGVYKLGKEAMQLELKNPSSENHLRAVNTLCKDEHSVRVRMSEAGKRRGVPSAFFGRSLLIVMRVCGVVALPQLFTPDQLEPVIEGQKKVLEDFLVNGDRSGAEGGNAATSSSDKDDGGDLGDAGGSFENDAAASRSKGRFEIKLPMKPPFISPGFSDNHFMIHAMKIALLGDRILIDTFSFVTSMSGAPDQHWHNDVPGLFTSRGNVFGHLPPQGIVAVVPFDKMDHITGPTEHLFGSHVALNKQSSWERVQQEQGVPSARVQGDIGDVVLFDVRLRHRGTANRADHSRSIAYVAYSKGFWVDDVNFKHKQTKKWDGLSSHTRRALFRRVDTHEYAARLEQLLLDQVGEEKGKQLLEDLKSDAQYSQVLLGVLV
eukprot:g4998.t1